jgi:hypothetical protein
LQSPARTLHPGSQVLNNFRTATQHILGFRKWMNHWLVSVSQTEDELFSDKGEVSRQPNPSAPVTG